MGNLNGKRALVTGGGQGLGYSIVEHLLAAGADVAVHYFSSETGARELKSLAERRGRRAEIFRADLTKEAEAAALVEGAARFLGGLDVLVNNASDLGPTPLALLADTDCEALERSLATNLLGPFRLTKAVLGSLAASAREGRGAVVVNVSSDAATTAYPKWGAYGAGKAALRHLSAVWDAELAPEGVRFLSIDPGDMDTPLHAAAVPDADRATLKRPEDAAREVLAAIAAQLKIAATTGGVS